MNERPEERPVTDDQGNPGHPQIYVDEILVDSPTNPRALTLRLHPGAGKLPPEMTQLWKEISAVERTTNNIFQNDPEIRLDFFRDLHRIADLGLRGHEINIDLAYSLIEEYKVRLADKFSVVVRDRTWEALFGYVYKFGIPAAIVGTIIFFLSIRALEGHPNIKELLPSPTSTGEFDTFVALIIAVLWVPAGVPFGIFLEYIFKVDKGIPYEKIQELNPGRWLPKQQFVNCTITAVVFAFLMAIGFLKIGLFNVLLNDFTTTRPYFSLGIGFVAGFAYPYVRDIFYKIRPTQRED